MNTSIEYEIIDLLKALVSIKPFLYLELSLQWCSEHINTETEDMSNCIEQWQYMMRKFDYTIREDYYAYIGKGTRIWIGGIKYHLFRLQFFL